MPKTDTTVDVDIDSEFNNIATLILSNKRTILKGPTTEFNTSEFDNKVSQKGYKIVNTKTNK